MNAQARKGKSETSLRAEFDELVCRLGENDLESLVEEARRRYGKNSQLGADAVGMSTVQEAIALGAMGARVVGLSCISNRAAGLARDPLSHDEVIRAGAAAAGRLAKLLGSVCEGIAG